MKKKVRPRKLSAAAQRAAAALPLPTTGVGLGVDLERIERFRKMLERFGAASLRRIFTRRELDYCLAKARPWQHLAVRFAAKEAAYKALRQLGITATYAQVEVINRRDGAPRLRLRPARPRLRLSVSLSHAEGHALALVLAAKTASHQKRKHVSRVTP